MKANALSLLRFFLAIVVFFSHYHQLTGFHLFPFFETYAPSNLAVNCFFVLSGFLMPQSFQRSATSIAFYQKRFLRIYISYFIVVVGIAFVAFAFSGCDLQEYFSTQWLRYMLFNILTLNFLQPDLSCLFQTHLYTAVNGSLWSIKVELMFYIIVPLLYFVGVKAGRYKMKLLFGMLIIALLVNYLCYALYDRTHSPLWFALLNQLPAKFCFFMAGWLLYELIHLQSKFVRLLPVLYILAFVVYLFRIPHPIIMELPIGLALVHVFYQMSISKGQILAEHLGGVSYPLYLLHFPVIQFYVACGEAPTAIGLMLLFVIVLVLSYFLYLAESKVLQYVRAKYKIH
ncbi:MAG TPA: acyltransferase [Cytophagales bacterium]|nr:acyltransferase [Cytophagales bacterium]